MRSICLVIPYFGKFHNYFHLFLETCRHNPSVNWLIITDDHTPYSYPKNVKVVFTTFEELRDRIQSLYSFQILLEKPYKLCDYKVAYGEIFAEELSGFDFWGYCDCDLLFGDIRKFVTDDILNRYDKLFTRGHLTLYRNEPEVNRIYRTQQLMDFKQVYQSSRSWAFDEWAGMSRIWQALGFPFYDELVFDDIQVGYADLRVTKSLSGKGSPYHEHNIDMSKRYKRMRNITYRYADGRLFRLWLEGDGKLHEEEILYAHFQKRQFDEVTQELQANLIVTGNKIEHKQVIHIEDIKKAVTLKMALHNMKYLTRRRLSVMAKMIKSGLIRK